MKKKSHTTLLIKSCACFRDPALC